MGGRASAGNRGRRERAAHRIGRRGPGVKLHALALLLAAGAALAQSEGTPVELTGTLAKVRAASAITLAYRESSVPFSYLSPKKEPIGYSIELCKKLAEAIGEAVGRELALKWLAVTS